MITTNLGTEMAVYYEKQFFLQTYGGDQVRANYEWDYSRSKEYTKFLKAAQSLNTTGKSYMDKRTRGWKYYLANKKIVRKSYEAKHLVPPTKPNPMNDGTQTITFTRFSPLNF